MTEKREWEEWWDAVAPINFRRHESAMNKSHETNKAITRAVADVGGSVLDVGCATGITYEYIKPIGVKYVGVDFTEKFLVQARKLNPEIDVRLGSAFNLPFQDNSFSTVFCKAVLEHQHPKEYPKIVREMSRIARNQVIIGFFMAPRGKTSILLTEKEGLYANRYSKKEIIDLIKSLKGFRDLNIIEGLGSRRDAVYTITLEG